MSEKIYFISPVGLTLGEHLVLFRKIHGISRKRLAEKAGISERRIKMIETDDGEMTVQDLTAAFGVFNREITAQPIKPELEEMQERITQAQKKEIAEN